MARDTYINSVLAETCEGIQDYDLNKLYDWLMDEDRMPAQTYFTSGVARNIAKEIEFRLAAVTGGVKDALRFAEWVHDKNWGHDGDCQWFQDVNQINRKSTLQLYEKYLSEGQPE